MNLKIDTSNIFLTVVENKKSNFNSLIKKSIEKENSNLPEWVRQMDGMSGKKYRNFINNIISFSKDPRYLEIGCWKGSTSCSAIYGNNVKAYCIDNWTEFGGPKNIFYQNIKKCIDDCDDIEIVFEEGDFRDIKYDDIGKYNIYLFDGPHKKEDQYDGLLIPQDALDDEFIFICDDWNWEPVRSGTLDAIANSNLEVLFAIEIRTTDDDSYPPEENTKQNSDWHNGYYISVLRKIK